MSDPKTKCKCKLETGIRCLLNYEGGIICPHCGLQIPNQLELEDKENVWSTGYESYD